MKHKWIVKNLTQRQRLDVFIAERLPEITRSQIAKLLKNGAGTVNNKKAVVHQFLKSGDVCEFEVEARRAVPLLRNTIPPQQDALPLPDLRIIKETRDWLVIDKSAGLIVHAAPKNENVTLVDLLLKHDPKIAKVGENPERPGIVHRLDREVSGLMVIARTQDAYDNLKQQFAGHKIIKKYLALVHGQIKEDEGDIKFRIARSKTKARMAARPVHEREGKAAWTHFKTLKRFRQATLLELDIFSGRTHQIRAHLLALNHPVMGDLLYGRTSKDKNLKMPRLMLQSVHLSFTDPASGEHEIFDLPPAPEFNQIMKQLSSSL